MKETKQLSRWKAQFGKDYMARSVIDPNRVIPGFTRMIGGLKIRRILEVGCNRGHNLIALSKIGDYDLVGLEPLKDAVLVARESSNKIAVIEGNCFAIPFVDSYFDLVFTAGVLIHIAPDDLPKAIDEIYRVSSRYILAVEYFAKDETIVHYRGFDDMLWKMDFKKMYLARKPDLVCVDEGVWRTEDWGDECNWWLLEKKPKKA